jgi:hypothetical protein
MPLPYRDVGTSKSGTRWDAMGGYALRIFLRMVHGGTDSLEEAKPSSIRRGRIGLRRLAYQTGNDRTKKSASARARDSVNEARASATRA